MTQKGLDGRWRQGAGQNVQATLLQDGQCTHPVTWKAGLSGTGKPRLQCAVCRKCWVVGGVYTRIDPQDFKLRVAPYFRRGASANATAAALGVNKLRVCKVFKELQLLVLASIFSAKRNRAAFRDLLAGKKVIRLKSYGAARLA